MFQDSVPVVYSAIGTRVELDGPYDFELSLVGATATIAIATGQTWAVAVAGVRGAYYMGLAHMNAAVLHGLLVDYAQGKDLLGYDL